MELSIPATSGEDNMWYDLPPSNFDNDNDFTDEESPPCSEPALSDMEERPNDSENEGERIIILIIKKTIQINCR